jgi:hypothetical protein
MALVKGEWTYSWSAPYRCRPDAHPDGPPIPDSFTCLNYTTPVACMANPHYHVKDFHSCECVWYKTDRIKGACGERHVVSFAGTGLQVLTGEGAWHREMTRQMHHHDAVNMGIIDAHTKVTDGHYPTAIERARFSGARIHDGLCRSMRNGEWALVHCLPDASRRQYWAAFTAIQGDWPAPGTRAICVGASTRDFSTMPVVLPCVYGEDSEFVISI